MLHGHSDGWHVQEITVFVENLTEVVRCSQPAKVRRNGWDSLPDFST
jgi:hypothetical protein